MSEMTSLRDEDEDEPSSIELELAKACVLFLRSLTDKDVLTICALGEHENIHYHVDRIGFAGFNINGKRCRKLMLSLKFNEESKNEK